MHSVEVLLSILNPFHARVYWPFQGGAFFNEFFSLFLFQVSICYAVLSVPCGFVVAFWEGLASWLSCVWCFLVFLLLSHVVSRVEWMQITLQYFNIQNSLNPRNKDFFTWQRSNAMREKKIYSATLSATQKGRCSWVQFFSSSQSWSVSLFNLADYLIHINLFLSWWRERGSKYH